MSVPVRQVERPIRDSATFDEAGRRAASREVSLFLLFALLLSFPLLVVSTAARAESFPVPRIPYAPRLYDCPRATSPLVIDGRPDEEAWKAAPETEAFVDIEGPSKPAPRFATKARMLWDDRFFYVSAMLEEPDLWATLTERDAVIFRDHDFEVFIDPDADTHEYYEFEINALGTFWDLLLVKPYRDGGPAVNAWDIRGLKSAVFLDGTLNRPGDKDRGWSVELAFPWSVLGECAHRPAPPKPGDAWKVNFSRVEWRMAVRDGKSEKALDPATGKPFPEDNWVWSPQGLVNMHYPEMWGWVRFTDSAPRITEGAPPDRGPRASSPAFEVPGDRERWALRLVYYGERDLFGREGRYSARWDEIRPDPADPLADGRALPGSMDHDDPGEGIAWARLPEWPPLIQTAGDLFQARLRSPESRGSYLITQDGRVLFQADPTAEGAR